MEKRLRSALDKIYAEEALKEKTIGALHGNAREKPARKMSPLRLIAACATMCMIIVFGGFFLRFYTMPYAYVDLDVNPSIELTVNRFGRIIGASSYNAEGLGIVMDMNVRNSLLEDAIIRIMEAIFRQGYFQREGLVSATVQTDDAEGEEYLLGAVQSAVGAALSSNHVDARTDIYAVSRQTRDHAHEKNITPAKYLAITELKTVDPTATYEGCSGHSIGEIRDLTERCRSDHHDEYMGDEEGAGMSQPGGHHGNRKGNHGGSGHR